MQEIFDALLEKERKNILKTIKACITSLHEIYRVYDIWKKWTAMRILHIQQL